MARETQIAFVSWGEREGVVERHLQHEGFNFVKPIAAASENLQVQIQLGRGLYFQQVAVRSNDHVLSTARNRRCESRMQIQPRPSCSRTLWGAQERIRKSTN